MIISRFWNRGEPLVKYWLYKVAMVIYVLQNSILALLGSTIAAYKVLTVSGAQPNMKEHPGPKSVIALMLLITNNGFRYFVSDFFLSKIFDENWMFSVIRLLGKVSEQLETTKNIMNLIGRTE